MIIQKIIQEEKEQTYSNKSVKVKVKSLSRVQLLATPWTAVLVLKKLDLLDGFQQSLLKGKVRRVPGYVIDSCTFL